MRKKKYRKEHTGVIYYLYIAIHFHPIPLKKIESTCNIRKLLNFAKYYLILLLII